MERGAATSSKVVPMHGAEVDKPFPLSAEDQKLLEQHRALGPPPIANNFWCLGRKKRTKGRFLFNWRLTVP